MALDERADVLVAEVLGNDAWDEGLPHLFADARRRFLRPDARIIPARVRLVAQPVTVPVAKSQKMRFSPEATARWTERYGIDFSPLLDTGGTHVGTRAIRPQEARLWPRLSAPHTFGQADLQQETSMPPVYTCRLVASEDGIIDGVLLCWEADLAPGVCLSTHPDASSPDISWRIMLLLARESREVRRGDAVTLTITRGRSPRLEIDPRA